MTIDSSEVLSPSQLNALARNILEDSFPMIWVEGELGTVSRPASGHLYATLKDAQAQIRCAMFRPKSQRLLFVPREGLRVLARGRLTLYEPRGDYQLVLEHLEEAGEGALRRAFEALKQRLTAEGLFDPARKQALPRWPRRIAIITSPTGAVIRDILHVLTRRFPLLEVEILPSLVQGEAAAEQLTRLTRMAANTGRYEVIVLARGGGSLEDLWAFNDETLARAIAASPVPIVSAVGHETDFTLADFAADVRAPTPSIAAELLVPDRQDIAKHLHIHQQRLRERFERLMQRFGQRTDRAGLRLRALRPRTRLDLLQQRQREAKRHLQTVWQQHMQSRRTRLERARLRLHSHAPQLGIAVLRDRLTTSRHRLHTRVERDILQKRHDLQSAARALEAVNPLATVARGYAVLTREQDDTVIQSVWQTRPGDRVRARLRDGTLWLALHRIEPDPSP